MPFWLEALIAAFLLVGSTFALIGAIGLHRLPDFYTRLHAPTKATTLGVGCLIIASMLFFGAQDSGLSFHELLIALFLFITAPISAHILARAAMHLQLRREERTRGEPWDSKGGPP